MNKLNTKLYQYKLINYKKKINQFTIFKLILISFIKIFMVFYVIKFKRIIKFRLIIPLNFKKIQSILHTYNVFLIKID